MPFPIARDIRYYQDLRLYQIKVNDNFHAVCFIPTGEILCLPRYLVNVNSGNGMEGDFLCAVWFYGPVNKPSFHVYGHLSIVRHCGQ